VHYARKKDPAAHLLDDEVVVATAQTAVTGDRHHQDVLHWADVAQRGVHILNAQPLVDAIQNLQARQELCLGLTWAWRLNRLHCF
jgi:hypothetical protein